MLFKRCAICKRLDRDFLCPSCRELLKREYIEGSFESYGHRVHYLYIYHSIAKIVLEEYKLNARKALARVFADSLSCFLQSRDISETLFVPMPSSRRGLRDRGFCQIEEVLFLVDYIKFIPLLALNKHHKNRVQKKLNRKERISASVGKFCASASLDNFVGVKKIILVDDIYTTGASVKNAISTIEEFLESNNFNIKVEALVFAKGGLLQI